MSKSRNQSANVIRTRLVRDGVVIQEDNRYIATGNTKDHHGNQASNLRTLLDCQKWSKPRVVKQSYHKSRVIRHRGLIGIHATTKIQQN